MSDNLHLLWLGVAAVVVAAVLTIGTLAAADLLPKRAPKSPPEKEEEVSSPAPGSASRRA